MKNNIIFLCCIILLTTLFLHAERLKKINIDSQDLLQGLALDQDTYGVKIYDWKMVEGDISPIVWDESGNGWSPKGFERKGIAYLTNHGKITHHTVGNEVNDGNWELFFLGNKDKIIRVKLTPNAITQENPALLVDKVFIEEKIICSNTPNSKTIFYKIKFPKKQPFWMEENTMTSSKGTASSYIVSYAKKPICKVIKVNKTVQVQKTNKDEFKKEINLEKGLSEGKQKFMKGMMKGKVASYSNEDIKNVARYIESLEKQKATKDNRYSINVNVSPINAKIDITNSKEIFYQGILLPKKKYYFEISKQGYKTYKGSFKLIKDLSFDIILEKEKKEFIDSISISKVIRKEQSIQSTAATIWIDYPEVFSKNKAVTLNLTMTNITSLGKGGLSISFPQYKNTNFILDMNDNGFYSLRSYRSGRKLYSTKLKGNIDSKYVLIEGWSKRWDSYSEKSISLTIMPPVNQKYLIVDIRGVLISNNIMSPLVKTNSKSLFIPTTYATSGNTVLLS